MSVVMLIFGILTVLAALGVVLARQPVHSALFLVLTLFLVAIHYAMLGAHFVAATQILVYAGAIMVLVIFVIMLLGLDANTPEQRGRGANLTAALATGLLIGVVVYVVSAGVEVLPPISEEQLLAVDGSAAAVGKTLYTKYLYPFEAASVLILAGIVGAVFLGHEKKRGLKPGRGLKANRVEEGTEWNL